ncbi:anti-sigma factor family protein [Gryllotalpicola protaetiae]|uniref:Putative zinc-finger domain-containing protein n=1 Tax=Gryllotalpicola protaetiae TaxID=2419771 RepID=A0A387BRL1_9MICO|nr:zf-HC2 domain-containing protein [Gryllotalpicola protaetiae]AYG03699.1 hypothetical protein D7I44_09235 [Gryllotalpicola protaetiae]
MSDGVDSVHEWDAAYVLGALSPDDRRLFEEHLETCPECRASVAELAVMPALLAKVPAPEFPTVEEQPEAASRKDPGGDPFETRASRAPQGSETLASLAHRVRRRRITRRWVLAGASVLAAAAIAAAVVLPTALSAPPAGTQIALEQTTPSPVTATVAVAAKRWGTELTMSCSYAQTSYSTATRDYALYVTDASGQATRVSSWSAWPGSTIRTSAAVATPKAELRTLQIRDVKTGTVLLSSPVR